MEKQKIHFILIGAFVLLLLGIILVQRQGSRKFINSTNVESENGNQAAFTLENVNKEQSNINEIPSLVTPEFRAQAEIALAKGTIIQDGKDDWVTTGGKGDNPAFYEVYWIDIESLTVGIDDEYLYLKWNFNGPLPVSSESWTNYNGDQLKSAGFNIIMDTDNKQGVGEDTKLFGEIAIYGYINSPGPENPFGVGFWTNPVSKPNVPADEAYENQYDATYKWGGPEFDYVIAAAPLNILNIKKDQEVTLNIWAEAESEQYHHATFDTINLTDPKDDDASKILVKLGTSDIIKPRW